MGNFPILKRKVMGEDANHASIYLPSYFVAQPIISYDDINNVRRSWNLIVGHGGVEYKRMRSLRRVHHDHSCLTWFYNMFFYRVKLLAINCPVETTQDAFSNGRFLINIVRCMLSSQQESNTKFKASVRSVLSTIDLYGMNFYDMCMIGGVLFSTLHECLGEEFTSDIEYSWVKVYSALLSNVEETFIQCSAQKHRQKTAKSSTNPNFV